jgi:hypothetical protein
MRDWRYREGQRSQVSVSARTENRRDERLAFRLFSKIDPAVTSQGPVTSLYRAAEALEPPIPYLDAVRLAEEGRIPGAFRHPPHAAGKWYVRLDPAIIDSQGLRAAVRTACCPLQMARS